MKIPLEQRIVFWCQVGVAVIVFCLLSMRGTSLPLLDWLRNKWAILGLFWFAGVFCVAGPVDLFWRSYTTKTNLREFCFTVFLGLQGLLLTIAVAWLLGLVSYK
jgi:hypothetical protein